MLIAFNAAPGTVAPAEQGPYGAYAQSLAEMIRTGGLPLPLGGNVLRKDIPHSVRHDLFQITRQSIDYGLAHRSEAVRHSLPYARDMDAELAGKFIGMYVNDYTRDYGDAGRAAIRKFLGDAYAAGYIDNQVEIEFVE